MCGSRRVLWGSSCSRAIPFTPLALPTSLLSYLERIALTHVCPACQVVLVDGPLCRNWPECLYVAREVAGADSEPLITVKEVPERFIFDVESTGTHRPEDIVKYALQSMKLKLGTVKLRCDQMKLEFEEESKGDDAAAPRWTGEAAAESYMLNMEDVRGGV